jgi:hypothetical protein
LSKVAWSSAFEFPILLTSQLVLGLSIKESTDFRN